MSKYVINDTTLTAIGDAVREKGGTSALIPVSGLANAIINLPSGGGGEVEPIVLSGGQSYGCCGDIAGAYINLYGNTISTQNINTANYMFYNNRKIERIPFEINFSKNYMFGTELTNMFCECNALKEAPKMNDCKPRNMSNMFYNCSELQLSEDYFEGFDWSESNTTSTYNGTRQAMFFGCASLRRVPRYVLEQNYNNINISYSYIYPNLFSGCLALDEITDLVVTYKGALTSNCLSGSFARTGRVKNVTFATQEDGSPYVCTNWKNQTIDMTSNVGYSNGNLLRHYNHRITADKEVTDDATYQALKNDPDWFTDDMAYSRYNHDSAVNTINSLPDVTAGSGNSIKFRGAAGSATDGGAINTLTEEEIAVATSKGWTVTLV